MICNNNNNNINNNIKCIEHLEDDIFCICSQCDNTPICTKCLFSTHNSHKIIQITNETVTPILNEFQNTTIPKLNEYMINSEIKLNKLDNDLKELELKHNSSLDQIKSTFKQLHDNLSTKELDLQRQLITIFDENKKINSNAHTVFNNCNFIIESNKSTFNNNNNNNNNNYYIEILKYNHQSKQLLSNVQNNLTVIPHSQYNEKQLHINNNIIYSVNESLNTIFTLSDVPPHPINNCSSSFIQPPPIMMCNQPPSIPPTPPQLIGSQKQIKWANRIYSVFTDEYTPYGSVTLAIDMLNRPLTSKFSSVTGLILLNGFNQLLNSIPESITSLFIFNVALGLTAGSIPNHIKTLWFCDGFDQTITKGVIPSSVINLYLCDIYKPLTKQSIPSTVVNIYKTPTFKHSLTGVTNIIPKEVSGYGSYTYIN